MLNFEDRKDISFSWDELNCLLRPQYHLCEGTSSGSGLFFLFMASFYRCYCIDDYFLSPEKQYFIFNKNVIEPYSNMYFQFFRHKDEDELLSMLLNRRNNDTILFPGNMKKLFYAKVYERFDWAHYFLINGDDSIDLEVNRVKILDNLHLTKNNKLSKKYEFFYLTFPLVEDLIRSYKEAYCNSDRVIPLFHNEANLWTLSYKIRDEDVLLFSDAEYRNIIFDKYRLLSQYMIDKQGKNMPFELKLIKLIKNINVDDGTDIIKNTITQYMASVNFNNLYVKILKYLLKDRFNMEMNDFLKIEKNLERLRMKVFSKLYSRQATSDDFWESFSYDLRSELNLRNRVLYSLIKDKIKL